MNRSLITGIVLGAAVAAAAGAIGGYRLLAPAEPTFAEVLEAKEVTEEIPVSREVCKDVQVTHRKAPRDEHQILGNGDHQLNQSETGTVSYRQGRFHNLFDSQLG